LFAQTASLPQRGVAVSRIRVDRAAMSAPQRVRNARLAGRTLVFLWFLIGGAAHFVAALALIAWNVFPRPTRSAGRPITVVGR